MAVNRQASVSHAAAYSVRAGAKRLTGGGTAGNERLTAFVVVAEFGPWLHASGLFHRHG
jgi:hypothetical protein